MSERAFCSRRVTTTSDFKRAMRDLRDKTSPACCERRQSRARRAEEEGAEAFFPLRTTTK